MIREIFANINQRMDKLCEENLEDMRRRRAAGEKAPEWLVYLGGGIASRFDSSMKEEWKDALIADVEIDGYVKPLARVSSWFLPKEYREEVHNQWKLMEGEK